MPEQSERQMAVLVEETAALADAVGSLAKLVNGLDPADRAELKKNTRAIAGRVRALGAIQPESPVHDQPERLCDLLAHEPVPGPFAEGSVACCRHCGADVSSGVNADEPCPGRSNILPVCGICGKPAGWRTHAANGWPNFGCGHCGAHWSIGEWHAPLERTEWLADKAALATAKLCLKEAGESYSALAMRDEENKARADGLEEKLKCAMAERDKMEGQRNPAWNKLLDSIREDRVSRELEAMQEQMASAKLREKALADALRALITYPRISEVLAPRGSLGSLLDVAEAALARAKETDQPETQENEEAGE